MKNLKRLVGFPVGIMMLFASYIMVYCLEGADAYQNYASQLLDPSVLINQFLAAGVYYTIFINLTLKIYKTAGKKENMKLKDLVAIVVMLAIIGTVGFSIDKFARFDGEDVVDTLIGSSLIVLIAGSIAYLIANQITVNKINKKIEKRNETK